jgi:hypothetical protein
VFVTLIYSEPLNGTYHWFSILGIMGAVTIPVPNLSPRKLFIADALVKWC